MVFAYTYCVISPIPPSKLVKAERQEFGDTNDPENDVSTGRKGYSTHNPNFTYMLRPTPGITQNAGTKLKKVIFVDRGFDRVNDNEWGVVYSNKAKLLELALVFPSMDLSTDQAVDNAASEIMKYIPDSSKSH